MRQKAIFKKLFIVAAIVLSILPVLVTFSSLLTNFFNSMGWYRFLQDYVVPIESRFVAVVIRPLGIKGAVTPTESFSVILEKPTGAMLPIKLEWNCLGWQSLILLGITLITGLSGSYTALSKGETVLLGLLGTFLANIIRMAFIVSLAYYVDDVAAMIVHDYFAMFVALVWMLFFWWFSYAYVLEPKAEGSVIGV